MRFPAEQREQSKEPMAALIDVVLLLLVFLLLAGAVVPPEPFSVQPPRVHEASETLPGTETVLLGSDGRIAFGKRVVSRPEFVQVLSARVANGAPATLDVKADGRVKAGDLIDVLAEIERAGAKRVGVLVVETPP